MKIIYVRERVFDDAQEAIRKFWKEKEKRKKKKAKIVTKRVERKNKLQCDLDWCVALKIINHYHSYYG